MDTTCARNMAAPHRANIRNKRGDKNETRPALVHAARDVCVTTLASGGIHTALAPPSNSLLASARPELGVGRAAGRAGLGFNLDFNHPNDVALDPTTGNVYVTDCHNFLVRTIDPDGRVTTLAGSSRGCKDGQGRAAQFDTPVGVAVHHTGDIYADPLHWGWRWKKLVSQRKKKAQGFAASTAVVGQQQWCSSLIFGQVWGC